MSKAASRQFAVIRNDREYAICDRSAPLAAGCAVVVKIAMQDGPRWFEGRLTTKHPTKTKTLDVDLVCGFRERRIVRENVARIVGTFEKTCNI